MYGGKEYISSVYTSLETLIVGGAVEAGLRAGEVLYWKEGIGSSLGKEGFGELLIEL